MNDNNFDIFSCLIQLPKQILSHSNVEGLHGLILKYLASKKFFNFDKAAYFLDNPSFNCSKGIAGFHLKDFKDDEEWLDLWECPEKQNKCIEKAEYNQKIKNLSCNSLSILAKKSEQSLLNFAKQKLEIKQPSFLFSNVKNGNVGILFYEDNKKNLDKFLFESATALLGLSHH